MRKRRQLIRRTITAFLLLLLPIYYLMKGAQQHTDWNERAGDGVKSSAERDSKTSTVAPEIDSRCSCRSSESAAVDLCYHPPFERTMSGRRFDCVLLAHTKGLGLFERDASDLIDLSVERMPMPVFVTASSTSHWDEELRLIGRVQQLFPSQRLLFYDLGLAPDQAERVKLFCNVEYRRFEFDAYPKWVGRLHEYRWKPIIIAKTLKEFGAIWWLDSSVLFKRADLSRVYALLECRNRDASRRREFIKWAEKAAQDEMDKKGVEALRKDGRDVVENGWHVVEWFRSLEKCDKSAYLLHGWTGHGIYSATNPGVYEYFPVEAEKLKRKTAKMFEAGFAFVVRTKEIIDDVLKWYVLCALEERCMAPAGAHLSCNFAEDRYAVYADCHRFDQSVINVLLANLLNSTRYYWTSEIVDFFNIVRGADDPPASPKTCPKP